MWFDIFGIWNGLILAIDNFYFSWQDDFSFTHLLSSAGHSVAVLHLGPVVTPATSVINDLEHVLTTLSSLKTIDRSKMCLFGAGHAGYLVLRAMLANTETLSQIKCGIAQSPITDWSLGNFL